MNEHDDAENCADANFIGQVRDAITAWLSSEWSTKRALQQSAVANGWAAPMLAERLRQATLTPDTLASHLAISEHKLRQGLESAGSKFTIGDMIQHGRLQLAASMLEQQMACTTIIDIAHACGWDDPRRFAVCFKALWGITPTEFHARRTAAASTSVRMEQLDSAELNQEHSCRNDSVTSASLPTNGATDYIESDASEGKVAESE